MASGSAATAAMIATSSAKQNGHDQHGEAIESESGLLKLIVLKLLTLTTIITFLWSGLTINLLQLVNYLLVRNVNFQLFTKLNYYLMYSAWAQIVTLFDWFFRAKFTVYHKYKDQEELIFKDHSIFLANHGYELDWVGAWLVTDKFGHMASCKAMLKSDLKYIPVVGWSWALSDQLFLDRNWEKDKHKFKNSIDTLLRYRPLVATFFCEGTRFTKDKIEACQKFAKERNLQAPKYHLVPRTKGFVAVIKQLKLKKLQEPDLKLFIYDAQIAFDERGALTIADIIQRGMKPEGHIYFARHELDEIPDGEEECAQWLHNLYLAKDSLQEYFNEHHKYPGFEDRRFKNYRPRLTTIANWCLWTLYTIIPLCYLTYNLYTRYGTFLVSIVMSLCFMLSYMYLNWIMWQADSGNSKKVSIKSK